MAAGSRTVKVTEILIQRAAVGNQILYDANYTVNVEDSAGTVVNFGGGRWRGNFGTAAAFGAMTGTQMNTQVVADVTAGQASGFVPSGAVS